MENNINSELTTPFTRTCVKSENGYYTHFGINAAHASVWGNKEEDVLTVILKVSDNQSSPNTHTQEYWGWFDNTDNEFTLIYANYLQLSVCFAYGIKTEEEIGRGKAYRLEIVK